MAKRIKMVLYAEPGTGKSVFASKWPKPFFICTDGNYEWLEDFGADPNAHKDCHSYADVKAAITADYSAYETIVLDLAEDAFKWNEQEYCIRNRIDHLSDLGYGKGYDATRNEFFIDISKLLSLDKNILILMHGNSWTEKDRRGVEHWKYGPTDRIPSRVIKMIEGRVRYFLRAYVKDEEQENGTVIKRRWLSLVPKPNEFGIIRGVNENLIPQDIDLDFNVFLSALGFKVEDICGGTTAPAPVEEPKTTRRTKKVEVVETKVETKVEAKAEETGNEDSVDETEAPESVASPADPDPAQTPVETLPWEEPKPVQEAPKEEPATQSIPSSAPVSNADKLAAIRAKLANMKK